MRGRRTPTIHTALFWVKAAITKDAGRWILGLGESNRSFAVFERHYGQLNTG